MQCVGVRRVVEGNYGGERRGRGNKATSMKKMEFGGEWCDWNDMSEGTIWVLPAVYAENMDAHSFDARRRLTTSAGRMEGRTMAICGAESVKTVRMAAQPMSPISMTTSRVSFVVVVVVGCNPMWSRTARRGEKRKGEVARD